MPCQPGQAVGKGEVLVEIEGSGRESAPAPARAATPAAPPQVAHASATPAPPPPASVIPVSGESGEGTAIVAPMPGTVIRNLVEEGAEVKAGEAVILIETMKMENSLPAPVGGKVLSLPCSAGQVVSKGEVLARIG